MKVGIVAAAEICAIYPVFGKKIQRIAGKSPRQAYEVHISKTLALYIVRCNVGEISAAAATQYLIDTFAPDFVANYGFALHLEPDDAHRGRFYLVDHVIHYDFDVSSLGIASPGVYPEDDTPLIGLDGRNISWPSCCPEPRRVTCLSGDKYLASPAAVKKIRSIFPTAEIADMEAAGIALTCRENNIPCLIIKVAADTSHYNGIVFDEFYYHRESQRCLEELYCIIAWLTNQKPELQIIPV